MTTSVQNPPVPSAPTTAKTRRALLAGALGGLGAWAASAIGRATPVRAANGETVTVGDTFSGTFATVIYNNTNDHDVIVGQSALAGSGVTGNSSSGKGVAGYAVSGTGVFGSSISSDGVIGTSSSGPGVHGISKSAPGMLASSESSWGVWGESSSHIGIGGASVATSQPGILGWSTGNSTGIQGYSGTLLPAAKAKTGVYGYAAQDKYSRGVIGESPAGIGVLGISGTGYGVYSAGTVYTTKWYELTEIATPAAPVANRARLFIKDNGLGKTQVCVKFANGTVKVLATEG